MTMWWAKRNLICLWALTENDAVTATEAAVQARTEARIDQLPALFASQGAATASTVVDENCVASGAHRAHAENDADVAAWAVVQTRTKALVVQLTAYVTAVAIASRVENVDIRQAAVALPPPAVNT